MPQDTTLSLGGDTVSLSIPSCTWPSPAQPQSSPPPPVPPPHVGQAPHSSNSEQQENSHPQGDRSCNRLHLCLLAVVATIAQGTVACHSPSLDSAVPTQVTRLTAARHSPQHLLSAGVYEEGLSMLLGARGCGQAGAGLLRLGCSCG